MKTSTSFRVTLSAALGFLTVQPALADPWEAYNGSPSTHCEGGTEIKIWAMWVAPAGYYYDKFDFQLAQPLVSYHGGTLGCTITSEDFADPPTNSMLTRVGTLTHADCGYDHLNATISAYCRASANLLPIRVEHMQLTPVPPGDPNYVPSTNQPLDSNQPPSAR